jgi:hypothetical protein
MGIEGGKPPQPIIDDLGRCVLHPAMKLQHRTTSGEWRAILSECPLCVSGLPATPSTVTASSGGRHEHSRSRERQQQPQQAQAAMIGTSSEQKQGVAHAEEIEGFGISTERGGNGELKSFVSAMREIQPRPSSRSRNNNNDEVDSKGTTSPSRYSKPRSRQKDDNATKRGFSSSAPELLQSTPLSRQPFSHSQAERLLRNIQGTEVADGTVKDDCNELETLNDYDDSNRHSLGQLHDAQNFLPQIESGMQGGQHIEQEVYCSEIPFPASPQHMQKPLLSIPNHSVPDPHRSGETPIIESTGIASVRSEVQKRPDPTDTGELQMHHNLNQFHPPTSSNISPLPWNGGRHPVQNSNQHAEYQLQTTSTDKPMPKVLEQDEVSVMTMSSVTQQMNTKLHIQRQRHRHERRRQPQLEDVESDDESSSTDSTDSNDDKSGRVPSVKSSAMTSKVSGMCETKSASSKSGSSADMGGKINTCDYDERGWCRRHPTTVHLRKKNMFRSTWQVLLSHCPECCLDEMKRVRDMREKQSRKKCGVRSSKKSSISSERSESGETSGSHASSRGGRSSGGGKKARSQDEKKRRSTKTNKNPPISQLNLRSTQSSGHYGMGKSIDQYDDTRSVGTASTVTISSHTQSTGGRLQNTTNLSPGSPNGSVNDALGDYANDDNNMVVEHGGEDDGGSTAHVTRMPYIDKYGSHGWYTGQVDPSTGTPHGVGTMNYADGTVCYSEWNYGMSANPPTEIQEEPFLVSGGGGYSSYPRQPRHHSLRSPMGHGGRSYLATLTEDGTSSDYEYADDPPTQQYQQHHQQQQQSTVVCGMFWTDQCGNTGAYTGEVNFLSIPHGIGSMRYDHGGVSEGMWRNGEIMSDDNNSEKYRSSSSSPSSSSSSSSSSMEGERRSNNGNWGSVDVSY